MSSVSSASGAIARFTSGSLTKPLPVYHHVVTHNGVAYISGVQGFRPGTFDLPDDVGDEAAAVFVNVTRLLEECGSTIDSVLKLNLFFIDLKRDFMPVNEQVNKVWPVHAPARSSLGVSQMPRGCRVVADFVAAIAKPAAEINPVSPPTTVHDDAKEKSGRSFATQCRTIFAFARNYAGHAKELGHQLPPAPIFALKPPSSIITKGSIILPRNRGEIFHELELGVIIGRRCEFVPRSSAMSYVAGYAICLDITAMSSLQESCKRGEPWALAKGFRTFCPVSDFIPASRITKPNDLELWLKVNGQMRQQGSTADMLFKIDQLIEYLSSVMTLQEGDLILTGTLPGVAPIKAGDVLTAGITEMPQFDMQFDCVDEIRSPL